MDELRYPITPSGVFHLDIPESDVDWRRLIAGGLIWEPLILMLNEIKNR